MCAKGDTVRFTWPIPNGAAIQVTRSNNSAVCQGQSGSTVEASRTHLLHPACTSPVSSVSSPCYPYFSCPASTTSGETCDIFIDPQNYTNRNLYAYTGDSLLLLWSRLPLTRNRRNVGQHCGLPQQPQLLSGHLCWPDQRG